MNPREKSLPQAIRLVEYLAADHWVLPVWGAVFKAESQKRIPRLSRNQRLKMRNLGLSITLKREFVRHLMKLLKPQLIGLRDFLNNTELPEPKFAIRVPADIRNNILVYMDALLFELQSVIELTEQVAKFCLGLTSLPGKKRAEWVKRYFRGWWRTRIKNARNLYTHQSAPYFDLDFDRAPEYDLLFTVKHPEEIKKPSDYIRFNDILEAAQGMFDATTSVKEKVVLVLEAHNIP